MRQFVLLLSLVANAAFLAAFAYDPTPTWLVASIGSLAWCLFAFRKVAGYSWAQRRPNFLDLFLAVLYAIGVAGASLEHSSGTGAAYFVVAAVLSLPILAVRLFRDGLRESFRGAIEVAGAINTRPNLEPMELRRLRRQRNFRFALVFLPLALVGSIVNASYQPIHDEALEWADYGAGVGGFLGSESLDLPGETRQIRDGVAEFCYFDDLADDRVCEVKTFGGPFGTRWERLPTFPWISASGVYTLYFLPSLLGIARLRERVLPLVLMNAGLGVTIAGWFYLLHSEIRREADHPSRPTTPCLEEDESVSRVTVPEAQQAPVVTVPPISDHVGSLLGMRVACAVVSSSARLVPIPFLEGTIRLKASEMMVRQTLKAHGRQFPTRALKRLYREGGSVWLAPVRLVGNFMLFPARKLFAWVRGGRALSADLTRAVLLGHTLDLCLERGMLSNETESSSPWKLSREARKIRRAFDVAAGRIEDRFRRQAFTQGMGRLRNLVGSMKYALRTLIGGGNTSEPIALEDLNSETLGQEAANFEKAMSEPEMIQLLQEFDQILERELSKDGYRI